MSDTENNLTELCDFEDLEDNENQPDAWLMALDYNLDELDLLVSKLANFREILTHKRHSIREIARRDMKSTMRPLMHDLGEAISWSNEEVYDHLLGDYDKARG